MHIFNRVSLLQSHFNLVFQFLLKPFFITQKISFNDWGYSKSSPFFSKLTFFKFRFSIAVLSISLTYKVLAKNFVKQLILLIIFSAFSRSISSKNLKVGTTLQDKKLQRSRNWSRDLSDFKSRIIGLNSSNWCKKGVISSLHKRRCY